MSTHHPSDKIGSLMKSTVVTVRPTAALRDAAIAMRDANVGAVAVVQGDEVTGVLSERDVVRVVAGGADPEQVKVGEAMAAGPRYMTLADTVGTAAEVMVEAGVRHLPVVDDGELVGIVSIRDVVPALLPAP
jgi:CBS domain-containing protein